MSKFLNDLWDLATLWLFESYWNSWKSSWKRPSKRKSPSYSRWGWWYRPSSSPFWWKQKSAKEKAEDIKKAKARARKMRAIWDAKQSMRYSSPTRYRVKSSYSKPRSPYSIR